MTSNRIVARASVIATAVVTTVIVFAGAAMAAGGGDGGPIGPGPRGFGGRDGHHRGGGVWILVAAVLLAVLITWLIARRRSASVPQSASAETILAERLARSEISVDDYRTTLTALRESSKR